MFQELTDAISRQIQEIKTWAVVLEIAALVTAIGVIALIVILASFLVASIRRQDELLALYRRWLADQSARQQVRDAVDGFAARPQAPHYGPWR